MLQFPDKPKDRWILNNFLSNAGWHNFNGGSFSQVWEHMDHLPLTVLKTGGTNDGGHAYLDWVFQNKLWKENPHFPKIFQFYRDSTARFYWSEIERLDNRNFFGNYSAVNVHDYWEHRNFKANKLAKAVGMIHKQFADKYHPDLWGQNILQRHDGTPVISDPLSNARSRWHTR